MQSKPKSNSIVTHTRNDATGVLTFNVLGVGSFEFDPTKAAPVNREHAEYHGWLQRIVDGAAIPVADPEGNIVPKSERSRMKYAAMIRLRDHYESGAEDWSLAGGGGGARSITIEAIARVFECEYEEAVEMVERHAEKKYAGNTKTALAKLRAEPKVQAAMLAIRQERLPKPVLDADSELDSLRAA